MSCIMPIEEEKRPRRPREFRCSRCSGRVFSVFPDRQSHYLSLIVLSVALSFLCIAAAINHKARVNCIQIHVYTNAIRISGSQPYW
jgi:hypothetical protein